MSTRRRGGGRHAAAPPDVSPGAFPASSAFFGGYLHQDLVPIHGSPEGAARAFARDADPGAREAVRQELRRLITLLGGRRPAAVRRALETLGSAWAPSTLADVEVLLEHLSEPEAGQSERGEG
jgi:hypothetical protein